MTRRIVIGIDGSAEADRALLWGLDEAERRGVEAHLVSVFSLPMVVGGYMGGYVGPALTSDEIVQLRDQQTAALTERIERARETHPELTVTSEVVQGAPAPVLIERSAEAEVIVLGTTGAGAFESLLLGSVSHTVAHRAQCPVVLVPTSAADDGPRRVVVGVDGSEPSDIAVDWAAEEADLADADLLVVHVWTYPYRRRVGGAQDEVGSMMQADAQAVLDAAVARAHETRPALTSVDSLLVEGGTVEQLNELAGPGDLLVVGARGRGSFRSALLGSTSASLIHQTDGPVAIVRQTR